MKGGISAFINYFSYSIYKVMKLAISCENYCNSPKNGFLKFQNRNFKSGDKHTILKIHTSNRMHIPLKKCCPFAKRSWVWSLLPFSFFKKTTNWMTIIWACTYIVRNHNFLFWELDLINNLDWLRINRFSWEITFN